MNSPTVAAAEKQKIAIWQLSTPAELSNAPGSV
jgi:hypothetical protein